MNAFSTSRVHAVPSRRSADHYFSSAEMELFGIGTAERIPVEGPWVEHLSEASDQLKSFCTHSGPGRAGTGAVAFASLPFDPNAPGDLIVPQQCFVAHRDGSMWHIGSDQTVPPERRQVESPRTLRIHAPQDLNSWAQMINETVSRIDAGELDKVVLSRCVELEWDAPPDLAGIAERLWSRPTPGYRYRIDGHIGLSPELLIARDGAVLTSQPMAGTTRRTGDVDADQHAAAALMRSKKNRREHQFTIDAVHDELLNWCSYVDEQPEPRIIPAGDVQHLATKVIGQCHEPAPHVSAVLAALHPTPALGGSPREPALAIIRELEAHDRRSYGGPVGWLDAEGNGCFAVALRGLQFLGDRTATAHAGVGIVAGSDPESEYEETVAKLAAALSAACLL